MKYRDMSKAEFEKALERNGFRRSAMPLFPYYKTDALPGVELGAIMYRKPLRIARRTTIAYLIRERDRLLAERGAA